MVDLQINLFISSMINGAQSEQIVDKKVWWMCLYAKNHASLLW